jgi:hypothetical protein
LSAPEVNRTTRLAGWLTLVLGGFLFAFGLYAAWQTVRLLGLIAHASPAELTSISRDFVGSLALTSGVVTAVFICFGAWGLTLGRQLLLVRGWARRAALITCVLLGLFAGLLALGGGSWGPIGILTCLLCVAIVTSLLLPPTVADFNAALATDQEAEPGH